MKDRFLTATVICVMLALPGCRPAARSDALIVSDAHEALRRSDEIRAEAVTVRSTQGHVTLEGAVPSAEDRQRVEDLVDDVSGVKEISNELKVVAGAPALVTPPVASPPPGPEAATQGSELREDPPPRP